MPTNNPKISAYVPQEIYDRFEEFKKGRDISMSQAVAEIIAEYFGIDKEVSFNQSSIEQKIADIEEQLILKLEEMEQRIAALEANQVDSKQSRPSLSEFFSEERINKHYGNGSRK